MKNSMIYILGFFVILSFFSLAAKAKPELLSPIKISDNVYLLYANVGVVIGENDVTLIDSWLGFYNPGISKKIVAEVKKITNKPIKYVINTHSHGDHSGGNQFFLQSGATVIAQQNAIYSPFIDSSIGQPLGIVRFKDAFSLDIGNEVITGEHLIAHSFDDTFVYLEKNNILFLGDNYISSFWTSLGVDGLNSFNRWTQKALSIIDDDTKLVPGHGQTIITKPQLKQYIKDVKRWVARVEKLHDNQKSIDEIVKDKDTNELFSKIILDPLSENTDMKKTDVEKIIRHVASNYKHSSAVHKELVGVFSTANRHSIEVLMEGDGLVARQKNKFYSYLKPISSLVFELVSIGGGEQIRFMKDSKGTITGFTTSIPESSRYISLKTGPWLKSKL